MEAALREPRLPGLLLVARSIHLAAVDHLGVAKVGVGQNIANVERERCVQMDQVLVVISSREVRLTALDHGILEYVTLIVIIRVGVEEKLLQFISEKRRVGKEWGMSVRFRGAPD